MPSTGVEHLGRYLPPWPSLDVVSGIASADLPDAVMIAVGCTSVATDQKVKGRLAVRLPLADGRAVSYNCDQVALEAIGAAVQSYWADLAQTGPRQAFATTVEGWWIMEEPMILDPPTAGGYWMQASPTFQEEGHGWTIPNWTLPYYCEVMLFSDPWFMVKCWEWIEEESG